MSEVYTKHPDDIVFDDKYSKFNPLHTPEQLEATRVHIAEVGQQDPILILNGQCIDGRHRTKIAKELGKMVLCKDVEPGLSEEKLVLLCNTNTTGGRDFDSAQKAIQALKFTTGFKVTVKAAAVHFQVNRKLVSYAATIKGFGRDDILDKLMENKTNRIQLENMERPSRSLELIAKFVKAESENKSIVVDDTERISWKADAYIKTEAGKAWYYEQLEIAQVAGTMHLQQLLAEMANMKFKLSCNT